MITLRPDCKNSQDIYEVRRELRHRVNITVIPGSVDFTISCNRRSTVTVIVPSATIHSSSRVRAASSRSLLGDSLTSSIAATRAVCVSTREDDDGLLSISFNFRLSSCSSRWQAGVEQSVRHDDAWSRALTARSASFSCRVVRAFLWSSSE